MAFPIVQTVPKAQIGPENTHLGAEKEPESQPQETQPNLTDGNAELLRRMVGGTGFEPVAPTMSRSSQNT